MLHKMYIATRPIVIAFTQERNTFVTPKISTHTNASTCTPTSRWIALIGVLRFGLTFPRAVGSTPDRTMAYQPCRPKSIRPPEPADTAAAMRPSAKSKYQGLSYPVLSRCQDPERSLASDPGPIGWIAPRLRSPRVVMAVGTGAVINHPDVRRGRRRIPRRHHRWLRIGWSTETMI